MSRRTRLSILVLVLLFVGAEAYLRFERSQAVPDAGPAGEVDIQALSDSRQSGVMVTGSGTVVRVLPDDNDGSRHQRFVVRLSPGLTVLISHNIDLAPRTPVETGTAIRFRGQYEWNSQGGVIHWTHRDPEQRHPEGWIEVSGRRYE